MITISIANHKGGVGKSATCQALGNGLAALDWRVLMIDMDPQGSLTAACGVNATTVNMSHVLAGGDGDRADLPSILLNVADGAGVLHLAPSGIELAVNEAALAGGDGDRANALRAVLGSVAGRYDVCLIDCPPSLGLLTVNALAASTAVIIPTQPQIADIRGLMLFLNSVVETRDAINPALVIAGVLITFYDGRTIHHRDAVDTLRAQGVPLFDTMIGRSIRVAESAAAGESILTYDPENPQAENYRQFANEVNTWLKSARG